MMMKISKRKKKIKIVTKGGVDGGGRSAVDGGDGEGVLRGIGVELAEVVTSDDTSGDDIEKTHDCKSGLVGWKEGEREWWWYLFLWREKDVDEEIKRKEVDRKKDFFYE